ncbi:MAG: hypothetical protein ACYCV7_10440, partial [Acidimicrobiales bacterium]
LIDALERERLVGVELTRAEVLELGQRWIPELDPPAVPPAYAREVLGAYRSRRLTAARTVELLHGSVDESDLPAPDEPSLDDLRGAFEETV